MWAGAGGAGAGGDGWGEGRSLGWQAVGLPGDGEGQEGAD